MSFGGTSIHSSLWSFLGFDSSSLAWRALSSLSMNSATPSASFALRDGPAVGRGWGPTSSSLSSSDSGRYEAGGREGPTTGRAAAWRAARRWGGREGPYPSSSESSASGAETPTNCDRDMMTVELKHEEKIVGSFSFLFSFSSRRAAVGCRRPCYVHRATSRLFTLVLSECLLSFLFFLASFERRILYG
jgi:hypothetical protein